MARFGEKGQLVALEGNEQIPLTSPSGGAQVGGGSIAAGADAHVTADQILAFVAAALEAAGAPKITSTVISNTVTPDGDTDLVRPPTLTAGLTIANPSATPADGHCFEVDLFSASAQGLTWGSKYASRMGTLPTTTVAGSKHHYIGVEYNADDDKLYCRYAQVQP